MKNKIDELIAIRNQLLLLQSSIEYLITDEMEQVLKNDSSSTNRKASEHRRFPEGVYSKRDKLRHILSEADSPLTAKQIKEKLLNYGETLPNVDQSLVNLESDGLISSDNKMGRKRYFIANPKP